VEPDRLAVFAPWSSRTTPEALAAAVDHVLAAARAAWPAWISDADLLAAIAAKLADDADPVRVLRDLRAADLYLAQACGAGVADALAVLERDYLPVVAIQLRAMRAPDDAIRETTQSLRERMLVGDATRGPRIAEYAGTGDLRRWLKTSAVHDYLNARKRRGREVDLEEERVLDALADPDQDPALAQLKHQYRNALREAFAAALDQLDARSKTLLRYQYVDGAPVEQICAIFGVHRSTMQRWLAEARGELADRTLAALRGRLGANTADAHSIRRLVQSQVEVSLPRLLEAPARKARK